jgi:hypothetical protein
MDPSILDLPAHLKGLVSKWRSGRRISGHSKARLCELCRQFIEDVRSTTNSELDEQGGAWESRDPAVKAAYRKAHPLQNSALPWMGLAPVYRHHASYQKLCESAQDCNLCALLCRQFQKDSENIEGSLAIQLMAYNSNSPWNGRFSASVGSQKILFEIYYQDSVKVRAAIRDFRGFVPPFIPPGGTVSRNGWSDDHKILLSRWLHECLSTHESCKPKMLAVLPKRVIDVGPANGFPEPRLIASVGQIEPYITLSYCWGDPTLMVTTTTENIATRMQSIPIGSLPQTLQDAVHVTRALNIRYLWVDALCIIQNSVQDWTSQAAIMGHIYEGATLTISAAGAEDSRSGFLHDRSSGDDDTCCKLNTRCASYDDVHVRVDRPGISDEIDQSKIGRRAWTMQERLLSKRLLHFSKGYIGWECETHAEAERNMAGVGTGFSVSSMKSVLLHPVPGNHKTPGARYINTMMATGSQPWESIVEQYTVRELSHESDRLPALASIAEKYSSEMTNLAGLWDELLPRGLMWRTANPTAARHATNNVPSWSWASIQGAATYDEVYDLGGRGTKWHVEIVSANVFDTGPRFMGQVSGGELKMSGFLAKVYYSLLSINETSGRLLREEDISNHNQVGLDKVNEADNNIETKVGANEDLHDQKWDVKAWMDIHLTISHPCWCLPMGTTANYRSASYCLLLQEVNIEKLEFKRCGIARLPKAEGLEIVNTGIMKDIVLM